MKDKKNELKTRHLDFAMEDPSRLQWKKLFFYYGVENMIKVANRQHKIIILQDLKYMKNLLKEDLSPQYWMIEGILTSQVPKDAEFGPLVARLQLILGQRRTA